MAKRYCKICGAEWEENFDECWNCGMSEGPWRPADPDEQLWFDKDARRRLERKKRTAKKRRIKPVSKLNRGIFIPLVLGCAAIIKIIAQGGFSISSGLVYEVVGLLLFIFSVVYIVKTKMK